MKTKTLVVAGIPAVPSAAVLVGLIWLAGTFFTASITVLETIIRSL